MSTKSPLLTADDAGCLARGIVFAPHWYEDDPEVVALKAIASGEVVCVRKGEKPDAWRVPHILSFKKAIRTSCPADQQEILEGTVVWKGEIFCEPDYYVTDKHGVKHYAIPCYALGDKS